jgi:hypothetical protein
MSEVLGGCLCGAVRYKAAAAGITRLCWCRVCQYIAAGNATVNVLFEAHGLEVTGAVTDYASTADSGSKMHRRFCPVCGTHLFSTAESRPGMVFVRAGTLDGTEIARPSATIWASRAPGWACIDERIPRAEGQATLV